MKSIGRSPGKTDNCIANASTNSVPFDMWCVTYTLDKDLMEALEALEANKNG